MKSRFIAALVATLIGWTACVAQSPTPLPLFTGQSQPLGKILNDIKTAANAVGGRKAVNQIDESIKEKLGEKGFLGLDLNRRIVGYAHLSDEPEKSSGVILVPITSEADFKDFLIRLSSDDGEAQLELRAVDNHPGLYLVVSKDADNDVPIRLRFHDRTAYFGFNVPDAAMAASKLLPAGQLIRATDDSFFSYEMHLSRYPQALKARNLEQIKELGGMLDVAPLPAGAKRAAEELLAMLKRMSLAVLDEADVAAYRFRFDPERVEAVIETALIPKPGTPLAKEITARKPTENRFASLIGKDTVTGFVTRLPLFAPEIRKAIELGLEEGVNLAAASIPDEFQPLVEEIRATLTRTVKTGQFDLAASLNGPDSAGLYSVAVGVSLEETAKLEKILRELFNKYKADQPALNFLKLDVARVGPTSIHELPAGPFLPPDGQSVFGKPSSLYFAFAPKGLYLTFGPKALETIKAAIAAEPSPARVLDIQMNPARMAKLIQQLNPAAGMATDKILDAHDQLISAVYLNVMGGTELRIQIGLNLKSFLKYAMIRSADSDD